MLEGKNFVYLATVNPDGSPQFTPTWVDTDGHFVLINTAVGRVKHRNVKKNPHVALAITDQTNPYNLVLIRGKVVEHITGQVAEEHIDKMAKKYRGLDKYPNRSPGEQRVLSKIEPVKVSSRERARPNLARSICNNPSDEDGPIPAYSSSSSSFLDDCLFGRGGGSPPVGLKLSEISVWNPSSALLMTPFSSSPAVMSRVTAPRWLTIRDFLRTFAMSASASPQSFMRLMR